MLELKILCCGVLIAQAVGSPVESPWQAVSILVTALTPVALAYLTYLTVRQNKKIDDVKIVADKTEALANSNLSKTEDNAKSLTAELEALKVELNALKQERAIQERTDEVRQDVRAMQTPTPVASPAVQLTVPVPGSPENPITMTIKQPEGEPVPVIPVEGSLETPKP